MEQSMQPSSSKKWVGCIGKCTSGLTADELDHITDNIHNTLNHPEGTKIFKKFLDNCGYQDYIECLELYESCSRIIEKTKSSQSEWKPSLKCLVENVRQVKEMAEFLSGVPNIDQHHLERIHEALENPTRISLLELLEETRNHCRDYLSYIHKTDFKKYASEPCPMKK